MESKQIHYKMDIHILTFPLFLPADGIVELVKTGTLIPTHILSLLLYISHIFFPFIHFQDVRTPAQSLLSVTTL